MEMSLDWLFLLVGQKLPFFRALLSEHWLKWKGTSGIKTTMNIMILLFSKALAILDSIKLGDFHERHC
jgi:hypothetical protein